MHTGDRGHGDHHRGRAPAAGARRHRRQRTRTTDGDRASCPADLVVGRRRPAPRRDRRCCPAELRSHPERAGSRRDPGPGRGARDARRRRSAARARPPLAVLHQGLGRALRRHPRAERPACPDPASIYVCQPVRDRPVRRPGRAREPLRPGPGAGRPRLGARRRRRRGRPAVEQVADAAIAQVAAWAGVPDLRERVVVRRTVGPQDFAEDAQRLARRRPRAWRTRCARARSSARATPPRRSPASLRRREHHPRHRPADVPDQRRGRAQAVRGDRSTARSPSRCVPGRGAG